MAALAKAVKRAHFDQTFQGALVDLAQVDALAELLQAAEGAALGARVEDDLDWPFAHIFDGGHAKADGAAAGDGEAVGNVGVAPVAGFGIRRHFLDIEVQAGVVDVGGQHFNAHAPTLVDEVDDLFRLVALDEEQRGHVLHRVVGFEVGGLHTDDRVVRRMAFVKTIACKKFNIAINFCGGFFGDAVAVAAFDEDFLVLLDVRGFFLADGAAHQVGVTRRIACQLAQNLDDLFLVDDDAVGLGEDGGQRGVLVFHRLFFVHAADELGDVFQRAGAIEGDGGDDMLEHAGLHLGQHSAHALAFHLEDAADFAAGEQLERLGRGFALEGDGGQAELFAMSFAHQPRCFAHD